MRTRLVSLSLVSYKTGAYLPAVSKLAAEVRRVGAVLAIDATQALGRRPVSLEGVDYLMSSSFKWLLGPHGLGVVYVSPAFRERLDPPSIDCWYQESWIRSTLSQSNPHRPYIQLRAFVSSEGRGRFLSQHCGSIAQNF